jgi:ribonuclease-3
MSRRYNALVARETCAEVGRAIDIPPLIRLGRQAREDHANLSDNVVGDVVEALIGAIYLEAGLEGAAAFVRRAWDGKLDRRAEAPKHPKSALQEWAAAQQCRPPVYTLVAQHGPHHAPVFTVAVEVGGKKGGRATAEGSSKQEAEKAAAADLLAHLGRNRG